MAAWMKVVAAEVLVADDGERRGRICRRPDGRYRFVTERLTGGYGELLPYRLSEYPPSGVYERRKDAVAALGAVLGSAYRTESVQPVEFELEVGPYPPVAERTV